MLLYLGSCLIRKKVKKRLDIATEVWYNFLVPPGQYTLSVAREVPLVPPFVFVLRGVELR